MHDLLTMQHNLYLIVLNFYWEIVRPQIGDKINIALVLLDLLANFLF
jgi:hypothetical protein